MPELPEKWWRAAPAELLPALGSRLEGMEERAAADALARFGPNAPGGAARHGVLRELVQRLRNPLLLLLAAAAAISAATGDAPSALIILATLAASVALDFMQERRAQKAVERLRAMVHVTARVLRSGSEREIPAEQVVPGDVIVLGAGDLVPADGVLVAGRDVYVNEAALTGEAFPVEKQVQPAGSATDEVAQAHGALLAGSHVVSGMATLLACRTGRSTQLGGMAELIAARARPSPLEEGTRRFGMMLLRVTVFLVLFVVLVNAFFARPVLESFMFAVALAVGLTPELLPMIVSVTLARGALRLAGEEVVVKHPAALYTLGAMDVLCTDKTGTLTEGRIELERHLDVAGADSERVLLLAYVNSRFESGLRSPLDEAILRHRDLDVSGWSKLDELPFDFQRRRVSVLAAAPGGGRMLVVKGAPEGVLERCEQCESGDRLVPMDDALRERARQLFEALGDDGMRVLAICWRAMPPECSTVRAADEESLIFAGFAAFLDPARQDCREALSALAARGVAVKIVTGDNERVASHLCRTLSLEVEGQLLGSQIEHLDFDGLAAAAERTTLFCRVSPAQKTRIIAALRARSHVVGYMGDGINDAPALRAADVGISVDGAVDVAKDAADVILMRHHLTEVISGMLEGRRSYANVMKYLRMGTSSNFGNMTSMAAATVVLPFLPLLPLQVLLNNLLYDLSEVALPFDRVEDEELARPCAWSVDSIRRFMLTFGPLSSIFDFLTFGVLILMFQAGTELFRTGWFVESVASQVLVIFAIRSARPMLSGTPHPALLAAAALVVAVAIALPLTPLAPWLGFTPLPVSLALALAGLVVAYLGLVEAIKRRLMPRF